MKHETLHPFIGGKASAQIQEDINLETTMDPLNSDEELATMTTKKRIRRRKTSTSTTTTEATKKRRRRPDLELATTDGSLETNPQPSTTSTSSSSLEVFPTVTHQHEGRKGNLSVLRKYVVADIGLWQTCQMGTCESYGPPFNLLFEVDSSTWLLFVCRWIFLGGIIFTELLWFAVATIRYVLFNRHTLKRPRISSLTKYFLSIIL